MKMLKRNSKRKLLLTFVFLSILLVGCAGPSTQVLPQETTSEETKPIVIEEFVEEEVNPFYMQELIEQLTQSSRVSGSEFENTIAKHMSGLFNNYGYEVEEQEYWSDTYGYAYAGTNVIAKKRGNSPQSDILLIMANHDSFPSNHGISFNAVGITTLMETARLLAQVQSDTEIWFVSVSGSAGSGLGIQHFFDSITSLNYNKIIGAVFLEGIGTVPNETLVIETNLEESKLVELLKYYSQKEYSQSWSMMQGNHEFLAACTSYGISGLMIKPDRLEASMFTMEDNEQEVDILSMVEVSNLLIETAKYIMDLNTSSYLSTSVSSNENNQVIVMEEEDPIFFNHSYRKNSGQLGSYGKTTLDTITEDGNYVQEVDYNMQWFGVDQTIITNYHYTNGNLDQVIINASDAGIELAEMIRRIESVYGTPTRVQEEFLTIREYANTGAGYVIQVVQNHDYKVILLPLVGERETTLILDMENLYKVEEPLDLQSEELIELIKKVFLPQEINQVKRLHIYQDPIEQNGGSLDWNEELGGYDLNLNTSFLFDEAGMMKDVSKTAAMLTGFYIDLLQSKIQ